MYYDLYKPWKTSSWPFVKIKAEFIEKIDEKWVAQDLVFLHGKGDDRSGQAEMVKVERNGFFQMIHIVVLRSLQLNEANLEQTTLKEARFSLTWPICCNRVRLI